MQRLESGFGIGFRWPSPKEAACDTKQEFQEWDVYACVTSRLLLSFPDDNSAVRVAGGEHALVVVEADVKNGTRVSL